tara:strand:- start:171 stop:371 length:201 start_codon:yes stop_codon:yes gene_type:complete
MDKFTKGILTVIAVGIIGINVQMFNGGSGFFTKANAMNMDLQKVQICSIANCATVNHSGQLQVTPQ